LEKVIPRTAQRAVSFMRDAFQGYYKHWTPTKSEVSNLHKTINMLKVFKTLGLYVLEPSDIEECIILTRVREALQKISKDLLVEPE
jgi:sulfur relay (sulfurtransferase) DsrF/TusC family protein